MFVEFFIFLCDTLINYNMKKILFVLTLFICALQLAGAQDKNSLRVGLGADYFDTSNESDSKPGWSYPSLFAEYGHRFNSVFSAVATINTDFRRYQRQISAASCKWPAMGEAFLLGPTGPLSTLGIFAEWFTRRTTFFAVLLRQRPRSACMSSLPGNLPSSGI